MTNPYTKSNFERIADDNYQTVDGRCIDALIGTWNIAGDLVDCCSPSGSGIVNFLNKRGYTARGVADAFSFIESSWIVSNPPYKRGIVDEIINFQIGRVHDGHAYGVAMLLRNNFDFAKSRYEMFTDRYYAGTTKMMFRPWWTEDRTASPIHNYVWHVWMREHDTLSLPVTKYWKVKR